MNHVAIVTGGTRGIGRAICEELKANGAAVAANYGGNDEAAAKFTAETGIKAYKFDVGNYDACQEGVAQIITDLGPVDILVNNAGITRDGTIMNMTRADWDAVIDTNLGSCFNMVHAVWESMKERNFGRIVNIGSINGQGVQYGQGNYAASKSGIHASAKPMTSPVASCSSAARTPTSLRVRRCRSMAASTCIEAVRDLRCAVCRE